MKIKSVILYILITVVLFHFLAIAGIAVGILIPIVWIFWPNYRLCMFCLIQKIFNKKEPFCRVCNHKVDSASSPTVYAILLTSLLVILISNLCTVLFITECRFVFNYDILQIFHSLPPSSADLSVEQQFINEADGSTIFDIMVNTSQPVNLVEADLRFDNSIFAVQEIQLDKSFANIVTKKEFSNINGTINVIVGLPNPGFVSNGLVARVILSRKQAGVGNIQILSSSKVLANDGKGTDLLNNSDNSALIEIK